MAAIGNHAPGFPFRQQRSCLEQAKPQTALELLGDCLTGMVSCQSESDLIFPGLHWIAFTYTRNTPSTPRNCAFIRGNEFHLLCQRIALDILSNLVQEKFWTTAEFNMYRWTMTQIVESMAKEGPWKSLSAKSWHFLESKFPFSNVKFNLAFSIQE